MKKYYYLFVETLESCFVSVWLWFTIFLVAGPTLDLSLAFGPQELEGGQNRGKN